MFRQGGVRSSSKFHKAKAWRIQICTFCYAVNAVFWIDFCNCFHWYISIYGCILLQKCWIALWIRIAAQYLLRVAVHIFSVLFEVLLYVHCLTLLSYNTHCMLLLVYNDFSLCDVTCWCTFLYFSSTIVFLILPSSSLAKV